MTLIIQNNIIMKDICFYFDVMHHNCVKQRQKFTPTTSKINLTGSSKSVVTVKMCVKRQCKKLNTWTQRHQGIQ
jgi:hypothetical protein